MSTYRRSLFHVVFATKNRKSVFPDLNRFELFAYVMGICKNNECQPLRVGGYSDHIHLLIDLNPKVALADLVRNIKSSSSKWIRENENFPGFETWQEGYAAFAVSWSDKDIIARYIEQQAEHHQKVGFLDEYRAMLLAMDIDMDERYLP